MKTATATRLRGFAGGLTVASAKQLIVKPISAADANRIVSALHYSGKVVKNSQVHLGVFLDGKCGGAMQFGPSFDKRKLQGLVRGTLWNEFIELNRMAFADWLPRNGESRCIAYAMRWLKQTYPFLKWVVSFADGTQCGDGTIYRASGFVLTGITENKSIIRLKNGQTVASMTYTKGSHILKQGGRAGIPEGAVHLPGFQLRYVCFLHKNEQAKLTVPILPFSEIARRGAGMYRGNKRAGSDTKDTPGFHPGEGGSTPTPALHS